MFVGNFKEIVAISFGQMRRGLAEHKIDQRAPPAFVIVLARAINRFPWWHLVPRGSESEVKLAGVELQPDLLAYERIMLADGFGQVKQCADSIEEDRLRFCLFHWHEAHLLENCFLIAANTHSVPNRRSDSSGVEVSRRRRRGRTAFFLLCRKFGRPEPSRPMLA